MKEREWTPGEILKVSGSYWEACTLHAGVGLDIFSLIGDDFVRAEQLAERLGGGAPRGLRTLLDALSALGLLLKKEDRYGNTPFAKNFLVKGAPHYIGYMIMHHHHLVQPWSRLHEAVLNGGPAKERPHDEIERESFIMGMLNNAMAIAPGLARGLDLKGRRNLLDLGGGPGTYAVFFCLENPELEAVVYDLPTTAEYANKTIARFGLEDRIRFLPGDYLRDRIPGTYDSAWLSHILHSMDPEESLQVIKKAVAALEPGGLIMIHEFILDDDRAGPLFPALFSLNMLVNTAGGRSYSDAELRRLLEAAGVKDVKRMNFRGPTDSGILIGRV
jgi:SAM-dependent methyltransferase